MNIPLKRRRERGPDGRVGVRRAVVLMPNGLTLFNLFCGIYAIILAVRGEVSAAPGFIVLGGIADVLDGRVARATGTGSRFGEELDSLVDAISFGFAPALIMYLGIPNRGTWEWLLVFIFCACAVMRLARFNVEQAGRKKTHFHGLPSPAAGLTLASYYWFYTTPLYNQTVILFTDSKTLAMLPWHMLLRGLMAVLAALMISDVPYPAVPAIGFDSIKRIIGTLVVVGVAVLLVTHKEEFIFPALVAYVLYGVVKWMIIGLLGRSSTPDEIFWEREAELHDDDPRGPRRTVAMIDDDDIDEGEEAEDEDAVAVPSVSSRREGRERPRRERSERGERDRGGRGERERKPRERPPREPRVPRPPREEREPRDARDAREPGDIAPPVVEITAPADATVIEIPRAAGAPDEEVRARKRRRRRGGRGNRPQPGGGTTDGEASGGDAAEHDSFNDQPSHGDAPSGPTLPDTPTGSSE